ncbi:hypothetical protein BGZ65_003460 [Modicella reniformis]|uniref:Uncharacterized protein n=1 Tax=Modicella reniformis TaxID=1440133 RepID=A0A9P6IZM5_9FUNG|nr:hypothetical protein BGZ65_003460 [Modicella reniformis]
MNSNNLTITDDIHFVRKFFKHIPSLRLVSKIMPGNQQGKGMIEDYEEDAILTLFNRGQSLGMEKEFTSNSPLLYLPLVAIFPVLTHLELHKIPPDCIQGWETLMKQLKSLVVIDAGIEDVYDVIVTAVVKSERRRQRLVSREKARAVQIKEEQMEALKDAALTSQARESTTEGLSGTTGATQPDESEEDDDATIASLKMWPGLRHLSMSQNSFPALLHSNTFMNTQSLVSLDLSHNLFNAPPQGLIHLHNLNELNLSYNMIEGVHAIYHTLGNVAVLDLRGNRLESLSGLERLWNLEKVDVRDNLLVDGAEVGRLAALPGIREVWAEGNPYCPKQPKYRLMILAVFKANGHNVLLDGSFASFAEKMALSNMSPSFSTSISTVNNVANIPAASAPVATFAQDHSHSRSPSDAKRGLNTTNKTSSVSGSNAPINKPNKKTLVKANKRIKRVVNLDAAIQEEQQESIPSPPVVDAGVEGSDELHDDEVAAVMTKTSGQAQGSGADGAVKKKKVIKKKKNGKGAAPLPMETPAAPTDGNEQANESGNNGNSQQGDEKVVRKPKKRLAKMKAEGAATVAEEDHDPHLDHSLCRDGRHVHKHRLAHLEKAMTSLQLERSNNNGGGASGHQREPSRGIRKAPTMPPNGAISPRLRPSSPIGSLSSDEGATNEYKRKIEAMRNEAGRNWLKVLAEMDGDSTQLPSDF